jgi:hypothetical protein
MENKVEITPSKVAFGATIVSLAAGSVAALMWGLGMMAIGIQPAPMNLIGAFGFVTIGCVAATTVIAHRYFR